MLRVTDILQYEFLGNPVLNWGYSAITFLVTLTVLPIIRGFIARRRRSWTAIDRLKVHTAIELTTLLVERTSRVFLFGVALFLASRHLVFPLRIERVEEIIIVCVFWLQVGLWGMTSVRFGIDVRRAQSPDLDSMLTGSLDVILFCAGLIIWARSRRGQRIHLACAVPPSACCGF